VHVDQPANDFNTQFEVLHRDPERYSVNDPNVFSRPLEGRFYESVFPKGQVHLGWSPYAAVWLSRIPMLIAGDFIVIGSTGDGREAFERQAAGDWEAFLSLRASELSPGGRLVVELPGVEDEGASGFEPLLRHANDVLAEMVPKARPRSRSACTWCLALICGEAASFWCPSELTVCSAG
jgi:hypothetical protein